MPGTAGQAEGQLCPVNCSGSVASFTLVLHTPSWGEGQQLKPLENFIKHIQSESHLISTLSP